MEDLRVRESPMPTMTERRGYCVSRRTKQEGTPYRSVLYGRFVSSRSKVGTKKFENGRRKGKRPSS
jgi:hypothetical protein